MGMISKEAMAHMTLMASLPCGADLVRLDDHVAVGLFGLGPFAADRYPLRKGDALIACRHECPTFERCPLVEKAVKIDGRDEAHAFLLGIVGKFKPGKSNGNLADVRNADGGMPFLEAVPHFRGFVVQLDGKPHFIVPPMAPVVYDCDDCGNAGGDSGETDERVKNDLVGVHAGSIAQPNQEGKL